MHKIVLSDTIKGVRVNSLSENLIKFLSTEFRSLNNIDRNLLQ